MASNDLAWDQLDKPKLLLAMPVFGLAVRFPIYPPQLIKTRIQTGVIAQQSLASAARHIVKTEGVRGLWRGFGVSLFGLATGPVYVSVLESSKSSLRALNAERALVRDDSPLISMLAGAIGSVAGQTVAVPLDVVSQRLQIANAVVAAGPEGAPVALPSALALVRELGPSGLYRCAGAPQASRRCAGLRPCSRPSRPPLSNPSRRRGFAVSLAQYVPSSALTWGGFSAVSRPLRKLADEGAAYWGVPATAADLTACAAAGGVAGAITGVVTCPLDVVRTRLQTLPAAQARGGALGVVAEIWAHRGVAGFYAGVHARVATLSPLMMLIMGGYEGLKRACAKPGAGPGAS